MDDDDIQDYVANIDPNKIRNDTLEEVAQEFDKMVPFGDTAQSFATYVRMMKK
jgi:hypothetical protein